MVCKTNVGGMTVEQAMIKGTADATITAEKVLKNEIGYGANGERVVGTLVPPSKTMSGTIAGSVGSKTVNWDSGFVPNFVMLTCTNKSGEFKTPAIVWQRSSSGTWSAIGSSTLWNYYDGSGGSGWGTIDSVNNTRVVFSGLENGYNYAWVAWK